MLPELEACEAPSINEYASVLLPIVNARSWVRATRRILPESASPVRKSSCAVSKAQSVQNHALGHRRALRWRYPLRPPHHELPDDSSCLAIHDGCDPDVFYEL